MAPVDLRLRARQRREPAMQAPQPTHLVTGITLGIDHRPQARHRDPDPLIMPSEPMLGNQPLMNHAGLQLDIGTQHPRDPRLDVRGDHARLRAPA
jgi:hypothetical protein